MKERSNDVLDEVRAGISTYDTTFEGPFGRRKVIFADWIASSRAYQPIEDFISKKVLPFYANTHTTSSVTGTQTNLYREEARAIILQHCGGSQETHSLFFVGSGSTASVNCLVKMLIKYLNSFPRTVKGTKTGSRFNSSTPIALLGPFEHHSNILPWREAGFKTIILRERRDGNGIDIPYLTRMLDKFRKHDMVIGSFSACSNITGVMTSQDDQKIITNLFHSRINGMGLCFWDFAGGAPYMPIDVIHSSADAIFVSTHKLIGGINTPGVLIVKNSVLEKMTPKSKAPVIGDVGGGTVLFVAEHSQQYLSSIVHREEGGTPDIVGCIRAGLVFNLKNEIFKFHHEFIAEKEKQMISRIFGLMKESTQLEILGYSPEQSGTNRIAILSFLIKDAETGLYFHHNFIASLLNDLFGIQSRGGCSCAGIYAAKLMGVSAQYAKKYERLMLQTEAEGYKLGFTRLSLNYFTSEKEVDFILESVLWVAENCKMFLPLYSFCAATGEYKHKDADLLKYGTLQSYFRSEVVDEDDKNVFALADSIKHKLSLTKPSSTSKNELNGSMREIKWFVTAEDKEGTYEYHCPVDTKKYFEFIQT